MEYTENHDRTYSRELGSSRSKRRPLSHYSDIHYQHEWSDADSGFCTTRTVSDWNVSTAVHETTTFFTTRVLDRTVNHCVREQQTSVRQSTKRSRVSARKIQDSSFLNVAHIASPSKSDCSYRLSTSTTSVERPVPQPADDSWAVRVTPLKASSIRSFRDITNDTVPFLKPWSPPTVKSIKTPKKSKTDSGYTQTDTTCAINISQHKAGVSDCTSTSLKPWSPPPIEFYEKNIDECFVKGQNTFVSKHKSRKSSSKRRAVENKENISPNCDSKILSACKGRKMNNERTDCSKLHRTKNNIANNTIQGCVAVSTRPRMTTPERKPHRSKSTDSHVVAANLSVLRSPFYNEIDLDNTYLVASGSESCPGTPTKAMNNTYASIAELGCSPPPTHIPLPPPQRSDVQNTGARSDTTNKTNHKQSPLKRSPKILPGSKKPLIRFRKSSSDAKKRTQDAENGDLSSKSLLVATKYHKYTIKDIVTSYCKLVKDIVPEHVLPIKMRERKAEPAQDISVDSGHETLSMCSPKGNVVDETQDLNDMVHARINFGTTARHMVVSLSRRHEHNKVDTSEIEFRNSLREEEFYC